MREARILFGGKNGFSRISQLKYSCVAGVRYPKKTQTTEVEPHDRSIVASCICLFLGNVQIPQREIMQDSKVAFVRRPFQVPQLRVLVATLLL